MYREGNGRQKTKDSPSRRFLSWRKKLCGEGIGEDWQEAAPQKRSFKNHKGKTMTNA